ncbi:hypothetical protein [Citrobacter meridianamericanus]|uniref:hypothetical protein n=1 Tax=Citrobacter meridianamericanus TaxID=2894201 RepID=UPI00351D67ED
MANQQLTINLKAIASALRCLDRRSVSVEFVLNGIGTPEALKLKEVMSRKWNVLPVAPLGDPEIFYGI